MEVKAVPKEPAGDEDGVKGKERLGPGNGAIEPKDVTKRMRMLRFLATQHRPLYSKTPSSRRPVGTMAKEPKKEAMCKFQFQFQKEHNQKG